MPSKGLGWLAICSIAVFIFIQVNNGWNRWAADFSAVYYAGHFFSEGQHDQVYTAEDEVFWSDLPPAWHAALVDDGHVDKQVYPYFYPPFVAMITSPLTKAVGPQVAMNALLLINTGLLIASAVLAWFLVPSPRPPLSLWLGGSMVLLSVSMTSIFAIVLGQIQILVTFLCLLSFALYKRGAPVASGMVLALAAFTKVAPAAFAVIYLWDRDRRALFAFVAALVLYAAVSLAGAGISLHKTYLDLLGQIDGIVHITPITYSLEGFVILVKRMVIGEGTPLALNDNLNVLKPVWLGLFSKAVLVAGCVLIFLRTRTLPVGDRLVVRLLALSILVPLSLPIGWIHYFLLTTCLLPAVFVYLTKGQAMAAVTGYAVLSSTDVQAVLAELEAPVFPQLALAVPLLLAILASLLFSSRLGSRQANA